MAEKSIICFDYPLMDESNENSSLSMYKTKLVTGKPHQFTRFFYAFYLTMGSVLEVSVRMVCPRSENKSFS